jgi:hypothetical protein
VAFPIEVKAAGGVSAGHCHLVQMEAVERAAHAVDRYRAVRLRRWGRSWAWHFVPLLAPSDSLPSVDGRSLLVGLQMTLASVRATGVRHQAPWLPIWWHSV